MSDSAHHDSSHKWLIFFFTCFGIVMLGIGLWALACYDVNAPQSDDSGGGHGMILPGQIELIPGYTPESIA